jgi:UDP-glucose 4-epimerase
MSSVVLITGVSRFFGTRLAALLSADEGIERIIGVDSVPPAAMSDLGRAEFVRADIRNPLIAKVVARAKVDTIVHTAISETPASAGGRTAMKELNVIGTMQLLAAGQKSTAVRRLVIKSSTAVYGSSPRDPAVFTESMQGEARQRSGYGKDAVEIEGYVRSFARRRPDVAVTVLRLADVIGPAVDSPLARFLTRPIVPVGLGFDPRIQLLHEHDAIEVLRLAALGDRPGVFNVAGAGALLRSQVIRRLGRVPIPVPSPAIDLVGRLARRGGLMDFSPEQPQFLTVGRVVDTTALRTEFGYAPRYNTAEALDDYARARGEDAHAALAVFDRASSLVTRLAHVAATVSSHG